MIGIELITACAPAAPVETVQQIIQVESAGNPLALNANVKWVVDRDEKGNPVMVKQPNGEDKPQRHKVVFKSPIEIKTAEDAVKVAKMAMAAGHTVDLGLMQVNSANLNSLGYSVADMFDTCKNLAAGAQVYSDFYNRAAQVFGTKNEIHLAALSAYNTGDFTRGLTNGYVSKFQQLGSAGMTAFAATGAPVRLERTAAPVNPYTASSAVFTKHVQEAPMINTEKTTAIVSRNAQDSETPGVQIEHTASEAEQNGAFEETALSEHDAWESNAQTLAANDPTGSAIMIAGRAVR